MIEDLSSFNGGFLCAGDDSFVHDGDAEQKKNELRAIGGAIFPPSLLMIPYK